MSAVTLISLFPKAEELLELTPEDLGGVIIELMPSILQSGGMFQHAHLMAQVSQPFEPSYHREPYAESSWPLRKHFHGWSLRGF
jgi:hypothetical protein